MASRDVRRLNLAIQKWSEHCIGCLMKRTPDELADIFKSLTPEEIAMLDAEIDKKPTIVLPRTYRNEARMPSDEGFYTPPRSSKS